MLFLSLLLSSFAVLLSVTNGFLVVPAAAPSTRLQQQQLQQLQQLQQQQQQQQQQGLQLTTSMRNDFDLSSSSIATTSTTTSTTTSSSTSTSTSTSNTIDNEEKCWNTHYAQLQTFYRRHHHVRVPRRETSLYDWCQFQYAAADAAAADADADAADADADFHHQHPHHQQQQHQHRQSKLVAINFWDRQVQNKQYSWNEWYLQLMQFYVDHGHTNIPVTESSASMLLLAQWVHSQRSTSSILTHHQRQLLWSLNFVLDVEQADFEMQYLRLLELETATCNSDDPIVSVRQWKKLQESEPSSSAATIKSHNNNHHHNNHHHHHHRCGTSKKNAKRTTVVVSEKKQDSENEKVKPSPALWKWSSTHHQSAQRVLTIPRRP